MSDLALPQAGEPLRILITGSREGVEPADVHRGLLDAWDSAVAVGVTDIVWVHGAADGVDSFADSWLVAHGLTVERHRVNWLPCTGPDCTPSHRVRRGRSSAICPTAALDRDARMVDRGASLCLAWIAPCVKPTCRKAKPHGSHGASFTADRAEAAGILTKRWPW